ncbi:MAG: hypothetical protein HC825_12010 [Oscillatoriales cyanobacterium RM1_1_9]|nr:hypothetical protein [Oscillatoriales cyanobacterium RM1_1_9]
MINRKFGWLVILGLGSSLAIALLFSSPLVKADAKKLELLGQATFPTGFMFQDTEVGGLSGITYNPDLDVYYAISDDRGEKTPSRFYTLKIDLTNIDLKRLIQRPTPHQMLWMKTRFNFKPSPPCETPRVSFSLP